MSLTEVANVKSDPLFADFFQGNFQRLRKHNASPGWLNTVSQEQHSRKVDQQVSVLQGAHPHGNGDSLSLLGVVLCSGCEGKA